MPTYIYKDDQQQGPYDDEYIEMCLNKGKLSYDDLCWKEGWGEEWKPLSTIFSPHQQISAPPSSPNTPKKAPVEIESIEAKKKTGCLSLIVKTIGTLLSIFIVIAIIAVKDSDKTNKGDRANPPKPDNSPTQQQLRIGEDIKTDNFSIKVNSIKILQVVGNDFMHSTASDGAVYVAVQWSYKNISDKPISAFRKPSLHLKDPNGTKYDADIGASGYYATQVQIDAKVVSDLNPGISVTDANVFEISEDLLAKKGWEIFIDADSDIEIPFSYKKE